MKKGIIVLLIAIALIVLVSPGIIGRIAEESVDENLQRIMRRSSSPRNVSITAGSRRRAGIASRFVTQARRRQSRNSSVPILRLVSRR